MAAKTGKILHSIYFFFMTLGSISESEIKVFLQHYISTTNFGNFIKEKVTFRKGAIYVQKNSND